MARMKKKASVLLAAAISAGVATAVVHHIQSPPSVAPMLRVESHAPAKPVDMVTTQDRSESASAPEEAKARKSIFPKGLAQLTDIEKSLYIGGALAMLGGVIILCRAGIQVLKMTWQAVKTAPGALKWIFVTAWKESDPKDD
jgi:hypothetical protein